MFVFGMCTSYSFIFSAQNSKPTVFDTSRRDDVISSEMHQVDFSLQATNLVVGEFVIVLYEGEKYPGKGMAVHEKSSPRHAKTVTLACLEKADVPGPSKVWKWPTKADQMDYPVCDVVNKIEPPKLLPGSSRNVYFEIPEMI